MFFILDDRLIDISLVEHLTKCLGDLYFFDAVLTGDTLYDLFGCGVNAKFSVNGQIVKGLRDDFIIRSVNFGIRGDLVIPGSR